MTPEGRSANLQVCLVLLLTATLTAQTPARDGGTVPVAPPTGTASLSGIVRDGDNNPLKRASVSIRGDSYAEQLAGEFPVQPSAESIETIDEIDGTEPKYIFSSTPAGGCLPGGP